MLLSLCNLDYREKGKENYPKQPIKRTIKNTLIHVFEADLDAQTTTQTNNGALGRIEDLNRKTP